MQIFLFEPNATIATSVTRDFEKNDVRCVPVGPEFFESEHRQASKGNMAAKPILMTDTENSLEYLRQLRDAACLSPVIVVMEMKNSQRSADLLNAGADDVIIRPYKGFEVAARFNAIIRRNYGHVAPSVTIGDITAYFDGRDPVVNGERLRLSHREHAIFTHLALQHGRVITKESIYEAVYGMLDNQPYDKVIDVYICKLRKKIEQATGKQYIETVYGRGYKLSDPETIKQSKRPLCAAGSSENSMRFIAATPATAEAVTP
jgi:two-component system cell cycle response regulator CtrA